MQPSSPNPNAPLFSGEQSSQPNSPEKNQAQPKTSEVLPAQPLEQLRSVETHEQMTGAGVADNTPPVAVAATPTVTAPPPPVSAQNSSTVVVDSNPTTAADDDVIEKEWVNKSKKIIAATKGDPHLKEKEVSKLQADYMLKRYNKEVKVPDDA